MTGRILKAILILPGFALVYMPAAILLATANTGWRASLAASPAIWAAALALAAAGLWLMVRTIRLFAAEGQGTLAPWDPPHRFVAKGPYAHMRNPMLAGVLMLLLAEALLLSSWPLGLWFGFFFLLNTGYFILSEEPGLERRFGESYRAYKAAVPRWLPRLTPYRADSPETQTRPRP